MEKNCSTNYQNPVGRLLKPVMTHFDRYRTNGLVFLSTRRERTGFTLLELIIAASILSIVALLIYPAYRTNSYSYQLSVVESSLQQNARIGMKKMVKELEAGIVVIPEKSNDAKEGSINYGYDETSPCKVAFYLWDKTSGSDKVALYTALPTLPGITVDPALVDVGEKPLLYIRRYTSSWSDPEPLVLSDVKVTQLNFIIGGDNQEEILITLELAQAGPLKEWRTFKLVSAAKLGAR